MADKTISSLVADSPATEPYNGTEAVHADQGGTSVGLKLWMGVQTMTGSATVAEGCRLILLNAASGTATVPTTVPVGQDVEFIKIHASAGTWTGASSGSETFAGAPSFTLTDQYERQVWTKVTSTRYERKLWTLGAQEYETGTWTPELQAQSGSFGTITYAGSRYGVYRRIGDEWKVWICVVTDSINPGTATGRVRITLPSVSADLGASQGISIPYSNAFGGDTPTVALVPGGSSFVDLYFRSTPNGGVTDLDVTDLGVGAASNNIRITGTYIGV